MKDEKEVSNKDTNFIKGNRIYKPNKKIEIPVFKELQKKRK